MLRRITAGSTAIFIAPLMLGVGIGIGAVGAASAGTIASALQPQLTVLVCATTGACASVTNRGGGTAVLASSPSGLGVRGISTLSAGVTGESNASIGVNGKSVNGPGVSGASTGADGIVGISSAVGNAAGVSGLNISDIGGGPTGGPGVKAASVSGSGLVVSNGPDPNGVFGMSWTPTATIDARSTFNDALDIFTGIQTTGRDYPNAGPGIVTLSDDGTTTEIGAGSEGIAVLNVAQATGAGIGPPGDGLVAASTYGNGIIGATDSGPTVTTGLTTGTPLSAVSAYADKGADLYLGYGKGTFEVTNDGNVNASGTVTSGVTCAPTTCPAATILAAYLTRDAVPTIEDVGRAQLNFGSAVVPLDPVFAGAIDPSRGYSVLVTPEGDTRGMYVAKRTLRGFTVAENSGGRSSAPFSYRIVATPYGSSALRLPVNRMHRVAAAVVTHQQTVLDLLQHHAASVRAYFAPKARARTSAKPK